MFRMAPFKLRSGLQIADIFTKALPRPTFEQHRKALMGW